MNEADMSKEKVERDERREQMIDFHMQTNLGTEVRNPLATLYIPETVMPEKRFPFKYYNKWWWVRWVVIPAFYATLVGIAVGLLALYGYLCEQNPSWGRSGGWTGILIGELIILAWFLLNPTHWFDLPSGRLYLTDWLTKDELEARKAQIKKEPNRYNK